MKINEMNELMMKALEKYPGVLPMHIFTYGPWLYAPRGRGYGAYIRNLKDMGLFDELYWELWEEKKLYHGFNRDQNDKHIAEWVDKLQNHPELLSDAEKEWIKNNPEYKEIVIHEGE